MKIREIILEAPEVPIAAPGPNVGKGTPTKSSSRKDADPNPFGPLDRAIGSKTGQNIVKGANNAADILSNITPQTKAAAMGLGLGVGVGKGGIAKGIKSGVKYLKSLFKKNPEAAKKLINQNPAAKMPNTRPINRKTNKYDTKPGTHPADPENAATKKANDNLDWDPVTAKEKADWDKYATPDEKALAAELGNHAKRSPDQIKYKRMYSIRQATGMNKIPQ